MPVGRYCSLPGTSGAYAFAPLHGRPTAAPDVHSPPKCFPIAADTCQALLFSAMNMGGVCNTPLHGRPTMAAVVHSPPSETILRAPRGHTLSFHVRIVWGRMQYAPTRMSDNGCLRSFAPKMFSDCGGCLSGAIVPCREHRGRMLLRPYTDVRQWPMTFVGPQNGFRRRRIPDRRYCFLPGTWGAYAIRPPLHRRPTMAAVVHSPPKCFPIAADTCRALLFPTRNMGGVCNTPLHGRPTMAAVVHSPPKCFPIAADTCRALLFPTRNMGGVCNTPLHGRPTMADDVRWPPKWFPTAADTR